VKLHSPPRSTIRRADEGANVHQVYWCPRNGERRATHLVYLIYLATHRTFNFDQSGGVSVSDKSHAFLMIQNCSCRSIGMSAGRAITGRLSLGQTFLSSIWARLRGQASQVLKC